MVVYLSFKSYFLITIHEKYELGYTKKLLMIAQWHVWSRIHAQIQMEIIFFFEIMIFIAHLICHIGINCSSPFSTCGTYFISGIYESC